MEVARQEGVIVDGERIYRNIEHLARPEEHGSHQPSMLQDVVARRQTEVSAINGEVVARGEKHGVPTPYNQTVTRLLEMIQRNYTVQV